MTKAQEALRDLISQTAGSESNLYPFIRDLFVDAFGYPKDHIRVNEKDKKGIPDVSLIPADVNPKSGVFWTVCEVKKELGAFRSKKYRDDRWENQLKRYVSADTIYALLIDPITIAVLRPNGSEIKVVELDKHSIEDLLSPGPDWSLAFLRYENSVGEASLAAFKEGQTPSRYLDVNDEVQREKFYEALRLSARELIDFSTSRLAQLEAQYDAYKAEVSGIDAKTEGLETKEVVAAKRAIRLRYREPIEMFEVTLKEFEGQIGRQVPKKEAEAKQFLQNLYATEGSSLVLARILFVRFFEDHGMMVKRISNGGIKEFRQYHQYVKDDYQFLLTDAYREAEHLYRKTFEPSVFDWSHKGDGQLSRLLLRIFYRLNAFDFTKVTGDILGNLYERFLDEDKRKKLGEYYTPLPIAEYVLERIGFFDDPGPLLDPGCGSGTFLIAATTGLIKKLTEKGVQPEIAVQQAVDLVHGLDINMFAAFIAQLQMVWHLLPSLVKTKVKVLPDLKIYGGINSLEWLGKETLVSTILDLEPEEAAQTRAAKYKYVVGNPPYIRNERLKDTGPWRENYDQVEFRNSDVSYFFVARAIIGKEGKMPSWLEDGGRMCFVLPRAIADSDAASTVRAKLLQYKILEVTDLEDVAIHIFPSPQASGRATVAPVLLFVERSKAKGGNHTDIVTVPEEVYLEHGMKHSGLERTKVSQDLFKTTAVNPNGEVLTTIREDDVPILEKMMVSKLSDFMEEPTPTYGIKVGSGSKLSTRPQAQRLPIAKGLNVNTFYLDEKVDSWVDVSNVEAKSVWANDLSGKTAYCLSEVALAPQCSLFSPKSFAFNNTAVVILPKQEYSEFPWDVLINSSLIRFVHLLTLRTALIGVGTSVGDGRRASWCHMYPRVVSSFPVPTRLIEEPKPMVAIAIKLRHSATEVAKRWETIDQELAKAPKKSISFLNADFRDWQQDLYKGLDLRIEKEGKDWVLRPYDKSQALLMSIRGPYALLKAVKFLIEGMKEPPTVSKVQQLQIPENYEHLSTLIEHAEDPQSPEIRRFKELYQKADELIADGFGLTQKQFEYIQSRLSSPPLDVLQPRWPWKAAERRTIQEYSVDRFE